MLDKITYTANSDGFILGKHYAKGAPVPLSAAQAKYLVAPYGNTVSVARPKPAKTEPAPSAKKPD